MKTILKYGRYVLLSAVLLSGLNAYAKEVKITGMGIRTCAEWQQWKEAPNAEARAMGLEWAQGFISGHNVYARKGGETVSSVVADAKALLPLLDNFCQKNPDKRLLSAVIEITQSLGGFRINVAPKPPARSVPHPGAAKEHEA